MQKIYIAAVVIVAALLFVSTIPRTDTNTETDELKRFASYDELKNFIQNNAEDYNFYSAAGGAALRETAIAPAADSSSKSLDYSGTNVQVAGVDEGDIVKTDGSHIYTISGNSVVIVDSNPDSARILSQINFTNATPQDMFINGNRLVVFGNEYGYFDGPMPLEKMAAESMIWPGYSSQTTFIRIYDVSDRSNPVLTSNVSTEGYYSGSRMIGDYIYAIVNQPAYTFNDEIRLPYISSGAGFPDIYYFDIPGSSYNFVNIIALNSQTGEDEMKSFMMPSSQAVYASKENVYLIYTKWLDYRDFFDKIVDEVIIPSVPQLSSRISEIRSYNISKSAKFSEIENALNAYVSGLDSAARKSIEGSMQEKMRAFEAQIAKQREQTVINKISISQLSIEHKGQASVPGTVLNQFSMDEYNGHFRIATTLNNFGGVIMSTVASSGSVSGGSGEATATNEEARPAPDSQVIAPPPRQAESSNNLYVIDSGMNVVGTLEDLAPGERIYSVRFAGERAYMVTFRQVDPLFVIDLSSSPKVLGFLKVSGVSNYLHPIDETHIVGIGQDATDEGMLKGMKVSLFDVSDVANPQEISKIIIGDRGTSSQVFYDHKAFLYSSEKGVMVLPVLLAEIDWSKYPEGAQWAYGEYKWQGAYVFSTDGLKIRGRVTHAENGTEAYYGPYAVQRSLYIGDVLYTISSKSIKLNDINTLEDIGDVELPGYEERPIIFY